MAPDGYPSRCNAAFTPVVEPRDAPSAEPYTPCTPDDRALMILKSGATADWNVDYVRASVPKLSITGLQERVFLDRDDVRALSARMRECKCIDMTNASHMLPVERLKALGQALVEFARSVGSS